MRLIKKHSPIRPTRTFWSEKNQTTYFMESGLEREFALCCEFDPQVISYRCQPEPLYYRLIGNSRKRRYTPDTILEHTVLGLTVIEVKSARHALKPSLIAKHSRLKDLYAEQSLDFLVLTEDDFRDGHITSNYSNLYRFRRFKIDLNALEELKQHFPNGMTLGEVYKNLNHNNSWMSLAYQAIAHQLAIADLTIPLSHETRLEWTL